MKVDASEMAKLGADFKAGGRRVGAKGAAIVRKSAFDMQRSMQRRAAVDTGAMRASTSTTITGDGRFGTITAEIGPTVDYAFWLEYGTHKMGPQPFVGPGFDDVFPSMMQAFSLIGGELLP